MKFHVLTAACALAFSASAVPCGANAAPLEPVSYEICGGAAQLAAIARAVIPPKSGRTTAALLRVTNTEVRVSGSGGRYEVRAGGSEQIVNTPAPGPKACSAYGTDASKKLQSTGTISGTALAAIQAAMEYRSSHPWPLGAANVENPNASATAQIRGRYAFVYVIDLSGATLTCSGVEYYRVDPATLDVRPFDGCVEGHRPASGLPGLRQLPD